jgi:hypothetical protein
VTPARHPTRQLDFDRPEVASGWHMASFRCYAATRRLSKLPCLTHGVQSGPLNYRITWRPIPRLPTGMSLMAGFRSRGPLARQT